MTYQAGYVEGVFADDSRKDWNDIQSRPVKWSCWYPVSIGSAVMEHTFGGNAEQPLFTQGFVAMDATISNSRSGYPLVLLSHGTGGTANGLSWLATRLAQFGYICIGADHHGNTSSEPYRAEGFACWWERPLDLSFLIDRVNQIPQVEGCVNLDNISVAGFSLGGYSALALVGAITSMKQFDHWLTSNPSPSGGPREFPNLDREVSRLLTSSSRFRRSWDRHGDSFRDSRISKCVAIAPAPTVRGFIKQSLCDIDCPTFIVSGEADLEAPYEECASWLFKQNSDFKLKSLGENVGHYVFLPECTEHGRCLEPEICVDHNSIVRREVHDYVASMIRDFLADG